MATDEVKYIKNHKRKNIIIIFIQIGIIIAFLLLWEYLSVKKIINPFIFSSPSKIINTIINLHNKNALFINIFTTIGASIITDKNFVIVFIFTFFKRLFNTFYALQNCRVFIKTRQNYCKKFPPHIVKLYHETRGYRARQRTGAPPQTPI